MSPGGNKVFVEDIREGQDLVSPFLLEDLRRGQTKSGSPYAALKLKDRTGRVEARVWDGAADFLETFRNGDLARVRGLAESFQGQVQVKITTAERLDPAEVDLTDYLPASPYEAEEMFAELAALAQSVADPHLRGLLEDILTDPDLAPLLKKVPAAKRFHHAYVSGLLEHTLSLARAAAALAPLYPRLNRDLLLTGAILHDLGKVREFDLGPGLDYTAEGRLLGHLVLGAEVLEKKLAARSGFPPELALLLKHIIVSHHGEYELGSPKKPKILEALALHYLDELDAKMGGLGDFIERHADEETGWTDFNRLMERFFYRPELPLSEPTSASSVEPEEAEEARPSSSADRDQLSFLED